MKRVLTLVLAAAVTSAGQSSAQTLDDLLNALGKAVEEELTNRVEEARSGLESTAEVSSFDRSRRPSVLVRTSDGRLFQLRSVALSANKDLSPRLALAQRVDFSRLGGQEYEASFSFRQMARPTGGFVGGVLTRAVNSEMASGEMARTRVSIAGIGGASLDGAEWYLPLDRCSLRSIEFLEEEAPTPPAPAPRVAETGISPPPASVSAEPAPPVHIAVSTPQPPPAVDYPAPTAAPSPTPPALALPPPPPLLPVGPPATSRVAPARGNSIRLARVDGSYATCKVSPESTLRAGSTVLILRGGSRVARASVLSLGGGEAYLEISEVFGALEPTPGDAVRLERQ